LTSSAEIVRRNACDRGGSGLLIQTKQLRMGPYIGTVVSAVDRDISHDAYPVTLAFIAELLPLTEKFKLSKLVEFYLGR
jgi:hypothetical protein